MTVHVPADPVCLDLPEHELCQGEPPPSPVFDGREPRTCRFSFLPCIGVATLLHGLVFVLGLTLAASTELPNTVVSISLVSGMVDPGPPPGPAQVPGPPPAPSPVQEPVQHVAADPPVKAKSREPVKIARKDAIKAEEKPAPQPVQEEAASVSAGADLGATMNASAATETAALAAGGQPSVAGLAGGQGGGHGGGGGGLTDVRFGDGEGPRFMQRVMPRYPELARRRGREGLVVLRLTIDDGGVLQNAEVVEKAGFGLDEAALEAAKASTYAPARRGNQSVPCTALLPVRFALKGS